MSWFVLIKMSDVINLQGRKKGMNRTEAKENGKVTAQSKERGQFQVQTHEELRLYVTPLNSIHLLQISASII